MDTAFKKHVKEHAGRPNFKSKKNRRRSYRTNQTNGNIKYCGRHIKLPKLGMVRTKNKLVPQGRILNATVTREVNGHYYVSLCCTDVEVTKYAPTGRNIGLDVGLKTFAVTSEGERIPNPKYLKRSLKKLAKLQRGLSRKTIGSANRGKAGARVAKLHGHVAFQRADFLQKLTTYLVRSYDILCVEDLNVAGILKNHKLAQAISDVSWGEFVRILEYKSNWHGRRLVKTGTFYASSQTCSRCGEINREVKSLSIRDWVCPQCGSHHDRDINASINISRKAELLQIYQAIILDNYGIGLIYGRFWYSISKYEDNLVLAGKNLINAGYTMYF